MRSNIVLKVLNILLIWKPSRIMIYVLFNVFLMIFLNTASECMLATAGSYTVLYRTVLGCISQ